MAKSSTNYVCQNCGVAFSKWSGRCENCGEWNTLLEQVIESKAASSGKPLSVQKLKDVKQHTLKDRLKTGFSDLDTVLGGGFVLGSVSLLAGQPGIGKSTLLLQIAENIAAANRVLYVSGEESLQQLRLRSQRLGGSDTKVDVVSTVSANNIASTISNGNYDFVIIDSIQTITLGELTSSAGSVSQITNSSSVLTQAAKTSQTALVLVGHVTKEGNIAGPKVLEHLVDVVLNFEGDRYGGFKIIRSTKNRFGATNEAAIFEMEDSGLVPIENPSAALLEERQVSDGSVVLATMEGSRPILVEVQALVSPTHFGYPKRAASGLDINRLNLLIAMLSRRTKLQLSDQDIYVNVVGGMKITDPAADLAICMAVASAAKGMQLKDDAVVFGEVGLSGEVRHTSNVQKRVNEAKKLGFKYAIGPSQSKKLSFVRSVSSIREALNTYLSS